MYLGERRTMPPLERITAGGVDYSLDTTGLPTLIGQAVEALTAAPDSASAAAGLIWSKS